MKKLLLCFMLLLSVGFTGCTKNDKPVDNRPTFTVGMECEYAPFNWIESKKSDTNYPIEGTRNYAEGYDVQIAKIIADKLDRRLVIKPIAWKGLLPALDNDICDAVIAGMSPTDERKVSVDFTGEYYRSTHVLLMANNSKFINGKTLSDFAGAKVVGQRETLYDTLIDQLTGATHVTALDDVPTIITSITSKRNDITILEEPVAKGIVALNPDLTYIKLTESFNVSDEDVCVSIAIKKGQEDFLAELNSILGTISLETRTSLMDAAIEKANQ